MGHPAADRVQQGRPYPGTPSRTRGRGDVYVPLSSDPDAVYDEEYVVDLNTLAPLAAKPHMPDLVEEVSSIGPITVNQVCIGSCTNSSYLDMMKVAAILKGKRVHPDVSLTISPGSMQVFNMLAANGALSDIIASGARILECACGPCIGMGQSPESAGVSLRTFNRNFEGRSGTQDAKIYLVSPPELKMPQEVLHDISKTNVEYEEVNSIEGVIDDVDVLYVTRIQKERFPDIEDYLKIKAVPREDV